MGVLNAGAFCANAVNGTAWSSKPKCRNDVVAEMPEVYVRQAERENEKNTSGKNEMVTNTVNKAIKGQKAVTTKSEICRFESEISLKGTPFEFSLSLFEEAADIKQR